MSAGAGTSVQSQLATLREWVASAAARTYQPTDKRRYAGLTIDGSTAYMPPEDAIEVVQDGEGAYTLTEKWMTPREFEGMPEHQGW
jgi:hypothetical protein